MPNRWDALHHIVNTFRERDPQAAANTDEIVDICAWLGRIESDHESSGFRGPIDGEEVLDIVYEIIAGGYVIPIPPSKTEVMEETPADDAVRS